MFEYDINYLAVIVSAVVFFGIGSLWYGPLFGKAWRDAMGMTQEDIDQAMEEGVNMVRSFGLMFLSALFMAFVTAHMVDFMMFIYPGMGALSAGFMTGLVLWFGYVFAYTMTAPAFEDRPWSYVIINNGYWLIGIVVTGIITALWQ